MRRALVPLLLLLAVGCVSARQKTLEITYGSLNAARDSYVVLDMEAQRLIASQPKPVEDLQAEVLAYRARRIFVIEAFMVAYSAVAAASFDLDRLPEAVLALRQLKQELQRLRTGESR